MDNTQRKPRIINHRRPIEFRQVYGIAKMLIQKNPAMSDSDWKWEVKQAAAKQGYGEPTVDMLCNAMTQVEHVVFKDKPRMVRE